ncbi:MAG: hypothetical protein U0X91_19800 [Spirosomataceae bacterium]
MNALQKITLWVAFVLGVEFNLRAQVTIAFCKLEGGCKFYQTQYTYAQLDGMFNYLGTFEKDKGTLVFFRNKQNQDVHYPDKKRSLKELHAYFGGKGEPLISKGSIAPFEAIIQPENGLWEAITETPAAKNCSPQLATQLEGIAGLKNGNKNFKKPFTPEDLLPPQTPWLTTAPNVYKAIVLPETKPTIKSVYDFQVVSPQEIQGTLRMSFQIPSQTVCEVTTNFTFKRK